MPEATHVVTIPVGEFPDFSEFMDARQELGKLPVEQRNRAMGELAARTITSEGVPLAEMALNVLTDPESESAQRAERMAAKVEDITERVVKRTTAGKSTSIPTGVDVVFDNQAEITGLNIRSAHTKNSSQIKSLSNMQRRVPSGPAHNTVRIGGPIAPQSRH